MVHQHSDSEAPCADPVRMGGKLFLQVVSGLLISVSAIAQHLPPVSGQHDRVPLSTAGTIEVFAEVGSALDRVGVVGGAAAGGNNGPRTIAHSMAVGERPVRLVLAYRGRGHWFELHTNFGNTLRYEATVRSGENEWDRSVPAGHIITGLVVIHDGRTVQGIGFDHAQLPQPAAPVITGITAINHHTVQLDFQHQGDPSRGLRPYDVGRRVVGTTTWNWIATVSENERRFTDNQASRNTHYEYLVVARNAFNGTRASPSATVRTPTGGPAAPTFLTASPNPNDPSVILLGWEHSGGNVDGFKIWRWVPGVSGRVPAGVVPANDRSFPDSGRQASTRYCYVVEAYNGLAGTESGPTCASTSGPPSACGFSDTPSGCTDLALDGFDWIDGNGRHNLRFTIFNARPGDFVVLAYGRPGVPFQFPTTTCTWLTAVDQAVLLTVTSFPSPIVHEVRSLVLPRGFVGRFQALRARPTSADWDFSASRALETDCR